MPRTARPATRAEARRGRDAARPAARRRRPREPRGSYSAPRTAAGDAGAASTRPRQAAPPTDQGAEAVLRSSSRPHSAHLNHTDESALPIRKSTAPPVLRSGATTLRSLGPPGRVTSTTTSLAPRATVETGTSLDRWRELRCATPPLIRPRATAVRPLGGDSRPNQARHPVVGVDLQLAPALGIDRQPLT